MPRLLADRRLSIRRPPPPSPAAPPPAHRPAPPGRPAHHPAHAANGAKFDDVSAVSQTATHRSEKGNYSAKVIIERGAAAPVTRTAAITVGPATLSGSFGAAPATGKAPLNATLTASVTGG